MKSVHNKIKNWQDERTYDHRIFNDIINPKVVDIVYFGIPNTVKMIIAYELQWNIENNRFFATESI